MKASAIDVERCEQHKAITIEESAGSAGIDAKRLLEFWINDHLCKSRQKRSRRTRLA